MKPLKYFMQLFPLLHLYCIIQPLSVMVIAFQNWFHLFSNGCTDIGRMLVATGLVVCPVVHPTMMPGVVLTTKMLTLTAQDNLERLAL